MVRQECIFRLDKGTEKYKIIKLQIGTWRSLEAHLNGVQGARGSNPRVPTIRINENKEAVRLEPPLFVSNGLQAFSNRRS